MNTRVTIEHYGVGGRIFAEVKLFHRCFSLDKDGDWIVVFAGAFLVFRRLTDQYGCY